MKKNTGIYKKMTRHLLIGAAVGGLTGAGIFWILGGFGQGVEGTALQMLGALQAAILPVLAVIWLAVTLTYTRSCVELKGEKALLK